MAILKCKMCGGDVELVGDKTFGTCEYCGCTMTFPKVEDDQRAAAFNRGNHFRRIGEFDKALAVYERIVQEDDTDAEAHWCCALCRFGIEYVEDPATMEWLPTCHRASFDSFLEDVDYLAAVEHSAGITRRQYQKDANKIGEVQRGILATSQNAEAYDVFICYKETDAQGNRTKDSLMAQDIYYQLTEQGRRVFFSRITLEDVAGVQYEPYIFAALNSAKVMIVVGTSPENLNAVWVKNEWSRFLSLMKKDHGKLLLPCYRDMDPYDLPEQLSVLQSYDMAKIGFIQDLTRGVAKVLDAEQKAAPTVVKETIVTGGGNVAPLLKRAFMFLEDGKWEKADEYCEQVLNVDPECAEAYLGKLMAELQVHKREDLKNQKQPFDTQNLYQKVIRFGDDALKRELQDVTQFILERNQETAYCYAVNAMNSARTEEDYKVAIERFEKVKGYKDVDALLAKCIQTADEKRTEAIYDKSVANMKDNTIVSLQKAINGFRSIYTWKDSTQLLEKCEQQCKQIKEQREMEQQKQQQQHEKRLQRTKRIVVIVILMVVFVIVCGVVIGKVFIPNRDYNKAVALMEEGKYTEAVTAFEQVSGYKDSGNKIEECKNKINKHYYNDAIALMEEGRYTEAIVAFEELGGYKDSENKIEECKNNINEQHYKDAIALMEEGRYTEAIVAFEELGGYKDSENKIEECKNKINEQYYNDAVALIEEGNIAEAAIAFGKLGDYKDAKERSFALWDEVAVRETISASWSHTVGLKADGTVLAEGENYDGRCDVSQWTDVVAISSGWNHTVGLKADGTVVAVGYNEHGRCDVSDWTDIVAISAGCTHTVGLKADGTVVAVGLSFAGECGVSDWTDIVAISAGDYHTVGLKLDGTVVAVGSNSYGQCDVSGWTDIVAVSAGWNHTVGLKADGTVVAVGNNLNGQCDVSRTRWTDIVAISAGTHTVGLKADGTVVAVGSNDYGECDVSDWTDIVAISAGDFHTVGLKADGTVVVIGDNDDGQCDVSDWDLF